MRIMIIGALLSCLAACGADDADIATEKNVEILLKADGCPKIPETVFIKKNGKITWWMDDKSDGGKLVDRYTISFRENPTDCATTKEAKVNQKIKCNIDGGAQEGTAYCYDIETYLKAGGSCPTDPTIFVYGQSQDMPFDECDNKGAGA